MNSLTELQTLQEQAASLVETLDIMSDTASGAVRQQLKRLSNLAWERYNRRVYKISEQVTAIWGQA